jgi:hypothetical protein
VIVAVLALLFAASPENYFDKKVAPILTRRCLPCHNNQLNNANVSFQDRATLLKGGPRGPAVVPGDPDKSMMIEALKHEGQVRMPPGPPLPKREVAILREWVKQGAVFGKPLEP